MGKRDLKINYKTLSDVSKTIKSYKKGLEDMEKAVNSIEGIIDKGKGQTVEKLVGKTEEFKGQIKEVKGELSDLSSILDDYIKAMNAIIYPIVKDEIMQVDRDDIYWNKQDIIGACEAVSFIPINVGTYGLSGGFTLDDSKEETEKKKRNYQKIEEIKKAFTNSFHDFEPWINKLNDVYKVVQDYEDKDDEFGDLASGLTDKYTDFWEGFSRFFQKAWKGIVNFAKGLLVSVKDLVVGLFSLAKGLICYIGSAVVVGCAELADVEPPKWAKDTFDGGNNLVSNIVRDPSIIAEGLAQGISDAWENDGAAYCVGYATGMIGSMVLADKGLSKLSKAGKAATSVDEAAGAGAISAEGVLEVSLKTPEDLLKYGVNSVDKLEYYGVTSAEKLSSFGISSVDDLLKFGVSSLDDLERLGLTSVEQLSKLGVSSADDLLRLGIKSASDLEKLGLNSTEGLKKICITDVNELVEKGIASEEELAELGIKSGLKSVDIGKLEVVETRSPEVANKEWLARGYDKPPYDIDYEVKVVNAGNEDYVRVFSYNADGTSNKLGGWIMRKKDIEGLTPAQIADKYALPTEPTHICDVKVKSNIKLQTGIANKVDGWGTGGGQQFDTMGKRLPSTSFINERLIGE